MGKHFKLEEEDIELLKGMVEKERNHAERCLNVNNALAEKQRERDLKRAELLERIIKFAEESDPTPADPSRPQC